MCTLIAFVRMEEDYPLVIASNRDEVPARPAREPRYITPDIFAPQDQQFGGTWIGVNRHGMMAAITNRRAGPHDRQYRSRGHLVMDALARSSVEEAAEVTVRQVPTELNGFHLLLSDNKTAILIWNDGINFRAMSLHPGVHVITGQGFQAGHSERDKGIRARAAKPVDTITRYSWLEDMLTFHADNPEDGACVHGPGVIMESRFSMMLMLNQRYWLCRWRTGRPCRPMHMRWHKKFVYLDGHH